MKSSMMPSMSVRKVLIPVWVGLLVLAFLMSPAMASASGATKIQMRDQTQNGLQPNDPVIGFVVFNQDANGRLIITVSLKGAVPDDTFTVELVTVGTNTDGGITSTGHYGHPNMLGTITTNRQGNGNAHFIVDVTALYGTVSGATNYGHIDVEDYDPPKVIADNQYGGKTVQWMQP